MCRRVQLGDVAGQIGGASLLLSCNGGNASFVHQTRCLSALHATISTVIVTICKQANGMRVFLSPRKDLREMLGSSFGKSLSGVTVSTEGKWKTAVAQLRTAAGHDPSACWAVPVMWNQYER